MNLWFVLFLAAVLATLTGLMVLLWRLYYSEDAPHTLDVAQLDQLLSTLRGLGFERIQRRSLFDVRTWRAEQRLSHMTMVVEFGDGTRRDYTRMTCTYDHPLCQGVQILRQEPLALSRRMMRLAEVKSGDARVDPKFIMLARDAERFEDLLSRPVRDLLLDVEDGAGDVQITDESVYAFYGALLTSDALVKKTEQVRALARTLGGSPSNAVGGRFRVPSILPTATQYARNSIFAGMMPLEISQRYPKLWLNDDEEGGKNKHEAAFVESMLKRHRLNVKHSYHKVITNDDGKNLADNILNLLQNDVNFIVYNFIDLLSHSRTEMNIIRELAPHEAAYRSLSRGWLEHSQLLRALRTLSDRNVKIILTTDQGTVRVKRPIRIIGDRNTTTNLRYKQGRNLNYDESLKHVFTVRKPQEARLPKSNVSSTYVFSMEDYFFAYPNNYNYYVNYYKDTFQHGGISLEEMLIPIVELAPKGR